MNRTRKSILTLLLLLLPLTLIQADVLQGGEGGDQGSGPALGTLLFSLKYGLALIFVIGGTALIWIGKMNKTLRIVLMTLIFIIFGGIVIGVHPSPVCATTKPLVYGLRNPFLAMLIFIGAVSLLANKSFCAMACPGGALQELIYRLPLKKRKNRKPKVAFRVSNTVRSIMAGLYLLLAIVAGISIFEYINFFEIFHWTIPEGTLLLITLGLVITAVLIVSAFLYRPFCYFLCPMGLLTWLVEQIGLSRINLDRATCTDCQICVHVSPCPSVEGILEGKKIRGDCHLCGDCIESCPEDSLSFGFRKG
ncbi:4Fe-4S binding protein [Gemmatimonadota bacterium]